MKMNKSILSIVGGALMLASIAVLPAHAHKVVVSAYAEGTLIEGEIGFSNGDVAADTVVDVLDEDGNKIGETKTDSDGVFQYTPTKSIPLIFRANLGQGHIANFRMEVEDLPEIASSEPVNANQVSAAEVAKLVKTAEAGSSETVGANIDPAILQALISDGVKRELKAFKSDVASAVRREVKPLRKEIFSYKEKNDMQSILGGVGYICGLFGIGFYVAARRERSKVKDERL